MLKIASWNVNSINIRLEAVLAWLDKTKTDVLALQETKVIDFRFPEDAFLERGYHVVYTGQKTYNGVAMISRLPIQDVSKNMGQDDLQKRYLAATIAGIRIINVYVPNGAAVGTDKYAYKLDWLSHLTLVVQQALVRYPKLMVLGDFNIAPEDLDVHDPARWAGSVLVSPPERAAYCALLATGLWDSFRLCQPEMQAFSWWDYRGGSFQRHHGLRIDLLLISEALRHVCLESAIDIEPRKLARPSDHAPVWITCEMTK